MTVSCLFNSQMDKDRNGNILAIRNSACEGQVEVAILSRDGVLENQSWVDGKELIKAIQNAMNS